MIMLTQISLTCPVCDNEFTSTAVRDRNGETKTRTDFQEYVAGSTVLPYTIHQCPRCGFAGMPEGFDGAAADTMTQLHVWNELMPSVNDVKPTASDKYEAAAKVALWRGEAPRRVADLWLCAAWCCVEEGDTEAERYYRRHAAWCYEDALSTFDGVSRDERAVIAYVIGELWRRIGDERTAGAWFDRVPREIVKAKDQRWIMEAASRQRIAPAEWFG